MKKIFWNEYVSIGAMTISIGALILSMVVPGPAGIPGSNGDNGSNGQNGTDGVNGTNGSDGINGSNGIDGLDGEPGDGVEFSIIDGVMMYRVGEGPWQRYIVTNPYQSDIESLDLPYAGVDDILGNFNLEAMESRTYSALFEPVVNQLDYVNERLDEGFIPINSVEAFLSISDDLEEEYVLTSNLDFSGITYTGPVIESTFAGVLDGAGYTLSNLVFNVTNAAGGLFEYLAGAIGNLTIHNAQMALQTPGDEDPIGYGFLAATLIQGSALENLVISNSTLTQDINAGLLIGRLLESPFQFLSYPSLLNNITIEESDIIVPNLGSTNIGGLIGFVDTAMLYVSNVSLINVDLNNVSQRTGHFIGFATSAFLNIYNNQITNGTITSVNQESIGLGGYVGFLENGHSTFINNQVDGLIINSEFGIGLGGFIGLIQDNTFTNLILNTMKNVSIEGYSGIGAMIGETNISEDSPGQVDIYIAIVGNNVTSELRADENVGGLIGHLFYGLIYVLSNLVNTRITFAMYGVGGFIGQLNEDSQLFALLNVSQFAFVRSRLLVNGPFLLNAGYVGGLVGVVENNVYIQAEANQFTNTIEHAYRLGAFGNPIDANTTVRAIGGLFGLTKQGHFLITDTSISTTLLFHLQYDNGHVDTTHDLSLNDIGGMVGSAFESNFYIYHSLFNFNVEVLYRLVDTAPAEIGSNLRNTGGLIGFMENSTVNAKHVHVGLIYNVLFEQVNENEPWNRLYVAIDAMGGTVGLLDESSLNLTLFSIDFSFDVKQLTTYFTFSSDEFLILYVSNVGGLIGLIQSGIYADIHDGWIHVDFSIDSAIIHQANSNASMVLELLNIAGFVGQLIAIDDMYATLLISEVAMLTTILDGFDPISFNFDTSLYVGFGDNYTPFMRIFGDHVYVYSNVDAVYGGGLYPFNIIERFQDEASLISFVQTWFSLPYWSFVDQIPTLQFLLPTSNEIQ